MRTRHFAGRRIPGYFVELFSKRRQNRHFGVPPVGPGALTRRTPRLGIPSLLGKTLVDKWGVRTYRGQGPMVATEAAHAADTESRFSSGMGEFCLAMLAAVECAALMAFCRVSLSIVPD